VHTTPLKAVVVLGSLNLYAPKSLHFVKEIPYRNSGFGASFDLKKISKKL
jgi:hypothetical protein